MEKFTYEGINQKRIEQFQLIIFSIYGINIMMSLIQMGKAIWLSCVVLSMLALAWIVNAGKYKTYGFRARITAIAMQVCMVIYATQIDSILRVLPIFMLFVVLSGLYGITDIIGYSVLPVIFIFAYHAFALKTISIETSHDILIVVLHMANVFFLQYVVYIWTKQNSEGSKQLLEVIEELGEVERSKDDFMANVSHEIRTPLNTICGMSEILLREELPDKTKESVLDIQVAGRNLMAVVSDILDYSELQSGKIELEEEAYSISSTINDVINMTMARKEEKKIELIVDCDANIPCALLGDEKKLRRVIMKLVDNAIKFTEEGCVSISVGYRKESYGINLLVAVKDTGIGMKEESLEKLFTKFSQADTGRNRQEGGIGLGLSISYALVKKMGGAITVRSKPGKGTVVQIAVPQKVLDEAPMASVRDRERLNVATYIDMEQFSMVEIRDEYAATITHMVEQLKVNCYVCRNLAELQRNAARETLTHVFISVVEYRNYQSYFDELALRTKVIVVLDRVDEKYVLNPKVLKIYKPFHILTVVSVVNAQEAPEEEKSTRAEKFEAPDAHILVVDDNRMNLRVIEGLLANYRIQVTTASGGQEALEKISAAEFDFVFMDHMMPEMDGVETLHHIRHKVGTYFQKVPVVALTANAIAGTREMLLAEGFDDFLEKPVERSVLERVLKRHLPSEKVIILDGQQDGGPLNMEEVEQSLSRDGLDVKQGVLYCNGLESYISVLQGYCDDSDELESQAQQLYEQADWKNYVITVHGIKGAMRSIGAIELAEIARTLEFAGKEGRIDFIRDNHGNLMDEYRKLFGALRQNKWIAAAKSKEPCEEITPVEELPELTSEEFDQILAEMEIAMYSLDKEQLTEFVERLQSHQYAGEGLRELLSPVKKKIEMSDYVSAVELTARVKQRLDHKE